MITILRSASRGHLQHGWLDTFHTFSFGEYHNPERMGFSSLRVINEDVIAPGQGFGRHPHRDMEILTYVVSGELAHQDSMGHTRTIGPGTIQRMTAGTGITHAEFNPSPTVPVHLLQIWLLPDAPGHSPSYEELSIGPDGAHNRLRLLASPLTDDGAATWHQDALLYAAKPDAGCELVHDIKPGRHAWVQVIKGQVDIPGGSLAAGDAASTSNTSQLTLKALQDSELLVFDLGCPLANATV